MKSKEDIERLIERPYLEQLQVPADAGIDGRILADALAAMEEPKEKTPARPGLNVWRAIMRNRTTKLSTAAVIVLAIALSVTFLHRTSGPVWAMDQTVEALKGLNAVYIVGTGGADCEIWMRADETGTQSEKVLVKGAEGIDIWVEDNKTYTYMPQENTVYFENAITHGFSHWLGPGLFTFLAKADDARTLQARDPASGSERILLTCSMIDVHGPRSWMVEFDVQSKLPVCFKCWPNLNRRGKPTFHAREIRYFKDLPDEVFNFEVPAGVQYVEKEPTIPEHSLALLADPQYGISAEGLTQGRACREILRQFYEAARQGDWDRMRKLCPICASWSDDFLNAFITGIYGEDRFLEIVQIENPVKQGHSKVGSFAIAPIRVRRKDASVWENKMIVQFRQIGGESSCVIHGPYGLPARVK